MSAPLSWDDELLAAELAFGLLDAAERKDAEARLGSNGAFADAHARWQAYAAAMIDAPAHGEAPSRSVWTAIEARLPANDLPANDLAPAPASLRWWRMGALAASAAAVILGIVAFQQPRTVLVRVPVAQQATPPMVAVLAGGKGVVTVSFDPATGRMTSAVAGLDVGNHSPELWVIPADGKPRSMGVMNASAPGWGRVPAPASSVMAAGVTIAVSVEPLGGSPTGQPTGPVILSGKLATA